MMRDATVYTGTVGGGHFVRAARIEWNGVPAEVRSGLESSLHATAFALPTWCTEVNVFWCEDGETDNGPAALSITVRDEYRFVSLFVHPSFLSYDVQSRYRLALHELSHALVRPLDALVDALFVSLPDDNKNILQDALTRAKESVTQDITEAFLRVAPYAS